MLGDIKLKLESKWSESRAANNDTLKSNLRPSPKKQKALDFLERMEYTILLVQTVKGQRRKISVDFLNSPGGLKTLISKGTLKFFKGFESNKPVEPAKTL